METPATPAQRACFELGIKFGALYHQFAGTPVSPSSATSLEQAIEESIENQPYCVDVSVSIDRDALHEAIDPAHGYAELTGTLMDCRLVVEHADVRAFAELVDVDGYPEMRITELEF